MEKRIGVVSNLSKSDIEAVDYLRKMTRSIKDYPKPGIIFRDLTTIFQDGTAFGLGLKLMRSLVGSNESGELDFDKWVGVEARGFVLAGGLAGQLGGGVVLARKPGKLPSEKRRVNYQLEYGTDALEIHLDAIRPGERVVVVDDLLATGGTAKATCELVEALGGEVVKVVFLVELPELGGRDKLKEYSVSSVLEFEGN
jgi:adenine phosphoribosyltransferase